MTKEEAFKQFCDEIAKEAPQYAEMMRDNCLIVGSFNRAWEDSQKNMIDKACEWLRKNMNIHQTSFTLTNPPVPGKFINAEEAFRKAIER